MEDEQKIRIDASASSDQVFPEIVWENRFHDLSVVSTTAIHSRTRFFAARGLFERFRGSKIGESISGPLRYSLRKHMIGAIFWLETRSNEGGTSRRRHLGFFSCFLNAKYLKWMLAPLKNAERLRCCQGPVAYAHRQRSVALRATTKQPGAGLRREALI